MDFRDEAIKHNSFIAYGDAQGRLLREYPVSGEIYEVSPGRTTLTLLSVHGVPVGPADQVVKPITDTAEIYIQNHSDSTQKKAHFGYLVDVMELDFITRVEFVHTVDTGSPAYEQLRAIGHECTYSDGTDPRAGVLQNSIDTKAEFIQLCRIIDPALATAEGW
ncbi:hypothetical protein [Hymenobacter coccineus]|uniref:Uncharacterized protein n=1 Tax=Hymenobacter coccineus TaxID=1908235 RepID=A0A1G1TGT9_9BACT|nr:hypothetical protein [Hymenobacter coccineus]OGX90023.1 hypothetical protein BEN49_07775 [Hymenobacter coccineus]